MIVTSNKQVSERAKLFGEEVSAAAILYRLLHNAGVLTTSDSSYRLRGRTEILTREMR
jgi:DNA replication protein DnaC